MSTTLTLPTAFPTRHLELGTTGTSMLFLAVMLVLVIGLTPVPLSGCTTGCDQLGAAHHGELAPFQKSH